MHNIKKLILFASALTMVQASAFGAATSDLGWPAQTLGQAIMNSVLFGILGIVLVLVGFKVFDRAITRVDLEKEISNGNIAAAILSAAVIVGISIIISAAIS
jgi:putative membrane protein